MTPVCLIASNDFDRVAVLRRALGERGLKLHGVPDFASLRPMLAQWRFDAVLCDAAGSAAGEVDQAVRSLHRAQSAPIVVLASPGGDDDALMNALEAGATELIQRNESPRVIAVRLQRLVDLATDAGSGPEPRPVSLGALELDPRRAEALFAGRTLRLTPGEFDLLFLLATRAGRFVHRDTIMRTIGLRVTSESRRSADMHVCRIRRKLKEAGASSLELETVYGRGYALRLRRDEAPAFRTGT